LGLWFLVVLVALVLVLVVKDMTSSSKVSTSTREMNLCGHDDAADAHTSSLSGHEDGYGWIDG
jgi:hypothetical protein